MHKKKTLILTFAVGEAVSGTIRTNIEAYDRSRILLLKIQQIPLGGFLL